MVLIICIIISSSALRRHVHLSLYYYMSISPSQYIIYPLISLLLDGGEEEPIETPIATFVCSSKNWPQNFELSFLTTTCSLWWSSRVLIFFLFLCFYCVHHFFWFLNVFYVCVFVFYFHLCMLVCVCGDGCLNGICCKQGEKMNHKTQKAQTYIKIYVST